MVEIGGMPILMHIMSHYAHYGFEDFVVALGYKGEVIKKYFVDYCSLNGNLKVNLGSGQVDAEGGERPNWTVDLVDTGAATLTGGRIKRLAPIIGNETFMLTWGDGVSDVNIKDLLAFHKAHGKLATMTAVRPPARYGHLEFEGNQVLEFTEKTSNRRGLDQRRVLRAGAAGVRLHRRRPDNVGTRAARRPGAGQSTHGLQT